MDNIDKRTINGNNGTRRGKDIKERKKPTGYYVLREEVKAGLRSRMETIIEYYGGVANLAREAKVSYQVVNEWRKRGMISADGAHKIHIAYKRNGCVGFRASWCRFDLRFTNNGKPITKKCDKRKYLVVVK